MSKFVAVFLGSKNSPNMQAWLALSDDARRAKEQQGMTAWRDWMEKNQGAMAGLGGPLGKTKRISSAGIEDVSNDMGAFMLVEAATHEAAAKLFENHPHFTIFPGERVEVMPLLPIPGE